MALDEDTVLGGSFARPIDRGLLRAQHDRPWGTVQVRVGLRCGIAAYSATLADAVGSVLDAGEFPVVLGGDCSIVLGCLLALKRRDRYGLLFLDGHADFYQPEAEPNGEAASMDFALATGRGAAVVVDLEGRRLLVRDEDVVAFGRRDAEDAEKYGSQHIEDTTCEPACNFDPAYCLMEECYSGDWLRAAVRCWIDLYRLSLRSSDGRILSVASLSIAARLRVAVDELRGARSQSRPTIASAVSLGSVASQLSIASTCGSSIEGMRTRVRLYGSPAIIR